MGKVVLTAAIMDLCHKGHLNLLKQMREEAGDGKVIVVLHDDQSCFDIKGKFPIQSLEHRMNNVLLTRLVDEVIPTHSTDPCNEFEAVIRKHGAENIVFERADDNKNFPGKHAIERHGIPIRYVPYTKGVSSTKLREELL